MTDNPNQSNDPATSPARSLSLPFDASEMMTVRLLPVEFARLLGVTKQSVSRWIKAGKITIGVDGRLDPTKATRELLQNTDPGRLRARLLRAAVAETKDLREAVGRVAELEERLAAAQARVEYLEGFSRELDAGHELFLDMLGEHEQALRLTVGTEEYRALLVKLDDAAWLSLADHSDGEAPQISRKSRQFSPPFSSVSCFFCRDNRDSCPGSPAVIDFQAIPASRIYRDRAGICRDRFPRFSSNVVQAAQR